MPPATKKPNPPSMGTSSGSGGGGGGLCAQTVILSITKNKEQNIRFFMYYSRNILFKAQIYAFSSNLSTFKQTYKKRKGYINMNTQFKLTNNTNMSIKTKLRHPTKLIPIYFLIVYLSFYATILIFLLLLLHQIHIHYSHNHSYNQNGFL